MSEYKFLHEILSIKLTARSRLTALFILLKFYFHHDYLFIVCGYTDKLFGHTPSDQWPPW